MIVAVDVNYRGDGTANAAAVVFQSWESEGTVEEVVLPLDEVRDYMPGRFYLRELPCIRQVLARVGQPFHVVVIDGYVVLGREGRPGLGMHLWRDLGERVPVVGVAKSPFHGTPEETKVYRSGSRRALYVTAAGMPLETARDCIASMNGLHRIPDLLRRVDRLCREPSPPSG